MEEKKNKKEERNEAEKEEEQEPEGEKQDEEQEEEAKEEKEEEEEIEEEDGEKEKNKSHPTYDNTRPAVPMPCKDFELLACSCLLSISIILIEAMGCSMAIVWLPKREYNVYYR